MSTKATQMNLFEGKGKRGTHGAAATSCAACWTAVTSG